MADFGNNVVFPASALEINNDKITELNLSTQEKSTKFVYKLLLSNISISDPEVIFAFDNEKEIDSKVKLNITAITIGKTITTISDIKLIQ
ncbi:hypothetical protein HYT84_02935 [Candidatus Micrarchaeota archaeon]|nr:hypothetical protein [Candidatus Micrarchaeota archaeon]